MVTRQRGECAGATAHIVVVSESARWGERTEHPRRHLGIVVVMLCIIAAEFGLFVVVCQKWRVTDAQS